MLNLEKRNTHRYRNRFRFLGARDHAAIIVGKNDDGLSTQSRIEEPFTADVEAVAIDEAKQLFLAHI
jgi:hypothetical protein